VRVAAQTIEAAPFSTLRLAPLPPMSVRTQPGQTALMMILRAASSGAQTRTSALSAIFETRYPDDGQPRSRWWPAATSATNMRASSATPSRVSSGSVKRSRRPSSRPSSSPMPLDTMTIVPPAGTSGSSASVTRSGPKKFTSIVRRATSASKPCIEMPALLTSTSIAEPAEPR
jgi:hypothetical protein